MRVAAGFALFFWSPPEGCWAVLNVSERKSRLEPVRDRLAFYAGLETRIVACRSLDDDDVVEVGIRLKPPASVDFVRPSACSS